MLPVNFILPGLRGDESKTELLQLITRLSAYNQLARDASNSKDEHELLEVASSYIQQILFIPRASIALLNQDETTFSVVSIGAAGTVTPEGHPAPLAHTAIERAVLERRSIHTMEFPVSTFSDWRKLKANQSLRHFIVSPIISAGLVYGTLNIGARSERYLSALDIFISRQFATILASNLRAHRNTAALEKASAAKGEFLAHMSHEIRTPMNAILGFTQLLNQDRTLSREQKGKLSSILGAGEHLLMLINQVLEMSRIEAGYLELVSGPIYLPDLITGLAEIFTHKARSKGLVFNVSLEPSLPQWILGDVVKVRQILINLLGNALRLTQEGSITLEALPAQQDGNNIEFRVSDTGPGIKPENQQRIFQDFQQVREAPGNRGTGLGLTISLRYARAMGGNLDLKSTFGVGSMFSFFLPLRATVAQERTGRHNNANLTEQLTALNLRALIADDEPTNLTVLEELLHLGGLNVHSCATGVEIIERCKTAEYDLIILDHLMPGLTGMETLDALKQNPSTAETPVIIASASVLRNLETEAIERGAAAFIRKPIDSRELLGAICDIFCTPDTTQSLLNTIQPAQPTTPQTAGPSLEEWRETLEDAFRVQLFDVAQNCDLYEFETLLTSAYKLEEPHVAKLLQLAQEFQWDRLYDLLKPTSDQ
jgi:two-component system, sensor histidine kinase and response regulator